jgi:hypothetical protein
VYNPYAYKASDLWDSLDREEAKRPWRKVALAASLLAAGTGLLLTSLLVFRQTEHQGPCARAAAAAALGGWAAAAPPPPPLPPRCADCA